MAISSRDIAKLRRVLDSACRHYGILCLDHYRADRDVINFLMSWLETWILIGKEIDFRDVVRDPDAGRVLLSMHSKVFNLARQGLYVYTAIEEQHIASTLRKLKALTAYSKSRKRRKTEWGKR